MKEYIQILELALATWRKLETEKLERNDSKITLRVMLKAAATKKLKLRVWEYSVESIQTYYQEVVNSQTENRYYDRKAICKKRSFVLRVQKKIQKKNKKKTKRGALPIGLIASAAAPFLGEIAKPVFKKTFGGRLRRTR